MANLIRCDYRMPSISDQLNSLMSYDILGDMRHLISGDNSFVEAAGNWRPSVDIKEEPERFLIYADIPGVECKDVEIWMDNGVLTIKGERNTCSKGEKNGYMRVERSQGLFYRRFALPDTADADSITARGKNGVLEIQIPKKEKDQIRKITVKEE